MSDAKYYRLAARIFADFSGTIAMPAVLAALLGQWLDLRYGTQPRLLIVFLALSLILTTVVIVRKARKYKQDYETLIAQEK
jgi:F0F1-type ATP synthase assembly protein I